MSKVSESMSILEDRSLESVLPHTPVSAVRAARRHEVTEFTCNLEDTMATISTWDTNYVAHMPTPDGDIEWYVLTERDEVQAFYSGLFEQLDFGENYRLNEISGSWYWFSEQVGMNRARATGEEVPFHIVVLVIGWTDGIIGELVWQPDTAWAQRPFTVEEQVRLNQQLDEFDDAWRAGDLDARLAAMEDNTYGVSRIAEAHGDRFDRKVARSTAELRAAWGSPEVGQVLELERVSHTTASSYVFAAYRMVVQLADRKVLRETACLFPLSRDLKFVCELSYSFETDL